MSLNLILDHFTHFTGSDIEKEKYCTIYNNRTHHAEIVADPQRIELDRCPYTNRGVLAFMFLYMFLGNIIQLNMLIAMMSNTFTMLTDTESVHRHQWFLKKYNIVDDYLRKTVWVPPFTPSMTCLL